MHDYDPFLKRLPHTVVPTNLPGAFASPAPDEQFDPNTASHTSLIKNGFFWRRPEQGDDPRLLAVWEQAFSQPWLAKDRIIPHLVPQVGKTHVLRGLHTTNAGATTSSNWSGGALRDAGNWSSVIGRWTIPTVSQPAEAQGAEGGWDSSSWIGIDGRVANDVLQAGVQQRVDANGNATYTAWYEWFCAYEKVRLPEISSARPALASLNGNLYLAWKGEEGRGFLNVMVSTNGGQSFINKFTSTETSSEAPALVAHQGLLFIAWKGEDGKGSLNVARVDISGNAITGFSGIVTLPEISAASPALVSLNQLLYLGWKEGAGKGSLKVMVSIDDGHTFGNTFTSDEVSTQGPALVAHNNTLYLGWRGEDGRGLFNVASILTLGTSILGFSPPPLYVYETRIDNFPVNPGDTVFCSVQYIAGHTAGAVSFANETTGQHFSLTLAPPRGANFTGESIEWIMEAPNGGEPNSALPSFTSVKFTTALGCSLARSAIGDALNAEALAIANGPQTLTAVTLASATVTITFIG